jgi:hypothetical protein
MGKAERAMKKKMGAKQEESGGEEEADAMDDHDL